jgi:hypothetical protein
MTVDAPGAFVASGEGDTSAVTEGPPGCGGNRSPGTAGICHTFTYNLSPDAGVGQGWAGVVWQSPPNNSGAAPGFAIPPGATKVTFWVKGVTGNEIVGFRAGGVGVPTATLPCVDTVSSFFYENKLGAAWVQTTLYLTGTYAGGVIDGFQWVAGAGNQLNGVSSITFYIDDIQWQM